MARLMNQDSVYYQGTDEILKELVDGLLPLYEMCAKYNQPEFPKVFTKGMYAYATRVFKVYAYIDSWDLDKIEHVFYEGMYWPLEGAFLSRTAMKYFDKCYNGKDKHVMRDEELREMGLPDNLNYTMIKVLPNGLGFALRTDSWINEFINSRNCFHFIELKKHD